MPHDTISASAVIDAPAGRLYGILADYRVHHPRIVPSKYFRRIDVEAGGVGAGTRTRVEMRVMGTTRRFVHVISEPDPGHILVEADPDGSSRTTFTVDPLTEASARVTISTEFSFRPGPLGKLERALSAAVLRRVYALELAQLAEYAGSDAAQGVTWTAG